MDDRVVRIHPRIRNAALDAYEERRRRTLRYVIGTRAPKVVAESARHVSLGVLWALLAYHAGASWIIGNAIKRLVKDPSGLPTIQGAFGSKPQTVEKVTHSKEK